ncbi:hypothetical protein [Desulfuromonas sp. TF]|uniref:hypothetical protein n=1 Tax=Desulfuromonas sp. TF TaxID=1232410 RepID=UPI0012DFBE93|nr:hypothetical protein [Desulfuromonas sp. TF]
MKMEWDFIKEIIELAAAMVNCCVGAIAISRYIKKVHGVSYLKQKKSKNMTSGHNLMTPSHIPSFKSKKISSIHFSLPRLQFS